MIDADGYSVGPDGTRYLLEIEGDVSNWGGIENTGIDLDILTPDQLAAARALAQGGTPVVTGPDPLPAVRAES